MAYELKFPDEGRGFILTLSGTLTREEMLRSSDEIFSRDLAADPVLYGLVDASGITVIAVSTEDIKDLADRHIAASRRMPETAVALCVYAREDVAFGNSRMWQTMAAQTGWDTHVARERSEAVAWVKQRVGARFGIPVTLDPSTA